ncbi:MAG: PEP-CTERM sorting domain-containing protein [Gemmataceae bacterium]|nr:PEP-CTERM sorting domain-containing protein [Gemmataceae bacterium]
MSAARRCLLVIALLVAGSSAADAGYTIQDFAASEYLGGTPAQLAVMNANLGIAGLMIEDFTGPTIPTGVLSFTGSGVIDVVPQGSNGWGLSSSNFLRITTPPTQSASILINGGTPVLGIGFSAFESGTSGSLTSLSINGEAPIELTAATLPNFSFTFTFRNGYLVITADQGDPLIESIKFTTSGNPDGYQFDYIAYVAPAAVPEPTSVGLLAAGAAGLLGYARRWRASRT